MVAPTLETLAQRLGCPTHTLAAFSSLTETQLKQLLDAIDQAQAQQREDIGTALQNHAPLLLRSLLRYLMKRWHL